MTKPPTTKPPTTKPPTVHEQAVAVEQLVMRLRPLFAGQPPLIQGAALADLLATWIAGHLVLGNERATRRERDRVLSDHVGMVRMLIPINAKEIDAELLRQTAAAPPEAGNAA